MSQNLETFEMNAWDQLISSAIKDKALNALEEGKVLFFPHLPFEISEEEKQFLNPQIVHPKSKNISYAISSDRLGGTVCVDIQKEMLRKMMNRYAQHSRSFIENLLPHYTSHLQQGRTSFRPVEASGRNISRLKDDTFLHVDSFPATPVKGKRILRIFCNVNPEAKPRVWRIGEPFRNVVNTFGHALRPPFVGQALLLKILKMTKDYRTLYDHYMLMLHNCMKMNQEYQDKVDKEEVHFPAGSTWIVYTDQVSHAALSGQHLFEQTFYLPSQAMQSRENVPLFVLEGFLKKALV